MSKSRDKSDAAVQKLVKVLNTINKISIVDKELTVGIFDRIMEARQRILDIPISADELTHILNWIRDVFVETQILNIILRGEVACSWKNGITVYTTKPPKDPQMRFDLQWE